MLSKLILLGATGTILKGYYHLRSEKLFSKIFTDVDKMPVYNIDYLKNLNDLPKNTDILLCGKLESTQYISLLSDQNKQAILRSFLITKEQKYKETDNGMKMPLGRMWRSKRTDAFNCVMKAEKGDLTINIEPPNRKDILLYELPSFRNDIKKNEIEDLNEPLLTKIERIFKREITYTEYALTPNKNFVLCGQVNNENGIYYIRPIIILGDNKEAFLDYLDQYLIDSNKEGKKWLYLTVGIIFSHFLLSQLYLKNRSSKQSEK